MTCDNTIYTPPKKKGGDENLAKLIDRSIESIDIPSGVTKIGNNAFQNCRSLKTVKVPEGVTFVGASAFTNCSSLEEIEYPSTVEGFENFAHSSNPNLRKMTIRAVTPPTLQNSTITGINGGCFIYVPASSVDAYKSAQYWSARANYIQAIQE